MIFRDIYFASIVQIKRPFIFFYFHHIFSYFRIKTKVNKHTTNAKRRNNQTEASQLIP